jgi:hypothetical protein
MDRVAELVRWLDPFPYGPPGGMVTLSQPVVTVTVNAPVLFTDEQPPTVSWSSSGATCLTSGFGLYRCVLVPGLDNDPPFLMSGTEPDGASYGFGGGVACSLPASGQISLPNAFLTSPFGPAHYRWGISAAGTSGQGTYAGVWFDILPVPKFAGAVTPPRIALVRSHLKEIDQKLRNGGILFDATLDTTVAAFREKRLNKYDVWRRLLLEIQNLQNLVFQCEDQAYGGGHWVAGSNTIQLYWKAQTGQGPSPEAVLHELVHKCGFNGYLRTWYSHEQIEDQTYLVASSCYP